MKNIVNHQPFVMEEYFSPGITRDRLIFFGSQTHDIWKNNSKLQAPEDYYLSGLRENNISVVRNVDPNYITYFRNLIGGGHVINLYGVDGSTYLSECVLRHSWIIDQIKSVIDSSYHLLPFVVTDLEKQVAKKLGVGIHASERVIRLFGTKSGVRTLAKSAGISMAPGYVCTTMKQIYQAVKELGKDVEYIVLKHDRSVSGYLSKKMRSGKQNIEKILHRLLKRAFIENVDIIVVEAWIDNALSVGAHIDILPGKTAKICAVWQQMIAKDGVSYVGAGPLTISKQALYNLQNALQRLADELVREGAVGSYGPDFLITSEKSNTIDPDSAMLIELNARIPYTAFPLEIIRSIKGAVGNGFFSTHIHLNKKVSFAEIYTTLLKNKLLVTKKDKKAKGVVPFNMGMLPWRSFNVVGMADTWEETQVVVEKVRQLFEGEK